MKLTVQRTLLAATAALLCQAAMAKGIEVSNAYARATVGDMNTSGVFLTVKNTDKRDNALIGGQSRVAKTIEVHEHLMENGMMKMRPVAGGVKIPAGKSVELKPDGYHVMLFGLNKPLKAGEKFKLTLKFKNGERKTVNVDVRELAAGAAHNHDHEHDHSGHDHSHHHH